MKEYIYLLQVREFVKTNEDIFKIGKTKQEGLSRISNYPKGSELYMQIICHNCDEVERKLIELFTNKYKLRKDIGYEYFEGNPYDMVEDISCFIKTSIKMLKDSHDLHDLHDLHDSHDLKESMNNTVRNFGDERFDFITKDDIKEAARKDVKAITTLIEKIYFNEKIPENHCIKYKNSSSVIVKENDKWIERNFTLFVKDLNSNIIKRICRVLDSVLDEKYGEPVNDISKELRIQKINSILYDKALIIRTKDCIKNNK